MRKDPTSTLRNDRGFTLVEMMIALLVFGVGLVALAQALPRGLQVRDRSQRLSVAASLAQEEVERLRSLPFNDADLAAGTHMDPSQPLDGGYHRRWVVRDGVPVPDMKRVEVTVGFHTASPDSSVTLTTQIQR